MKKNLLSSVLVLLFLLPLMAKAQDPGVPDTVFFKAGTPCSGNGDTLYIAPNGKAYIQVWVATDESTKITEMPLIDKNYGASGYHYLDTLDNGSLYSEMPAAFNGSGATTGWCIVDLIQHLPAFLLVHSAGFGSLVYYGDTLFATLAYTVLDTCTICLDSTSFFNPNHRLALSNFQGSWVPQFLPRCFPVRYTDRPPLQVSAPATDTCILGKSFSYFVEVSDSLNELLEDGAWLLLRNRSSGATYFGTGFLNRVSGQGTSAGVYEVSLDPFSTGLVKYWISGGEINFEMKFSGVNGAAGFDTTKVFLLEERGDVNGDGKISIADVIFMINVIVGRTLPPADWQPKADVNCNLTAGDMGDVVYLVNYLFRGGPGPFCY